MIKEMNGPPEKGDGARQAPITTTINTSATFTPSDALVQQQRGDRAIGLLWMSAKTLIRIDETLADIRTLQQQQCDLLRAILNREPRP